LFSETDVSEKQRTCGRPLGRLQLFARVEAETLR